VPHEENKFQANETISIEWSYSDREIIIENPNNKSLQNGGFCYWRGFVCDMRTLYNPILIWYAE
jgi:hypothetical protein